MINAIQPFINLANANLQAAQRFMRSQDMTEMSQSNLEQIGKVTQESIVSLAQSEAMKQWSRDAAQNFTEFTNQYTQSLFGVVGLMTQGQNLMGRRMQEFSQDVEQKIGATTQAFVRSAENAESQREEVVQDESNLSKARAKQNRQAG